MRLARGLAVGLAGAGLALAGGCTADHVTSSPGTTAAAPSTAPTTGTGTASTSSTGSVPSAGASTTAGAATTTGAGSLPATTGASGTTAAATTTTGASGTTAAATTTTATATGGSLAPPGANLSGTWTGTWTIPQDGTSGSLQIEWTQRGNVLHGTVAMEGSPCVDSGVVNGTIAGLRVAFAVNNRGETVALAARAGDSTLRGTFHCDVNHGTWRARKS